MDRTLEQVMEESGWKRWESANHGTMYYVWRREGFEIDEDEIMDLWGEKRITENDNKTKVKK